MIEGDSNKFLTELALYGQEDSTIHVKDNLSYKGFLDLCKLLNQTIVRNGNEGYRTCLFLHYGGHGMMDTTL